MAIQSQNISFFNRGTNLKLVYEIFDHYMAQNDKLFLFYMVTGLIVKNAEVRRGV